MPRKAHALLQVQPVKAKPLPGHKVGNHAKSNPVPLRLRNPYIPREQGGSYGWRGKGWAKIRKEALERDRKVHGSKENLSSTTGMDKVQGKGLMVDHINPFRLGGKNRVNNLRTTDFSTNAKTDNMTGADERLPKRSKW